jgi:hypothetical protein
MKAIFAAVLYAAAVISQISTASAQYYGPPGGDYHYGLQYYGPPGGYYRYGSECCAPQPVDLGWAYTRYQPVGYGESYPARRMADSTLACDHSNYRPIRGWCQRIW